VSDSYNPFTSTAEKPAAVFDEVYPVTGPLDPNESFAEIPADVSLFI